MKGSKIRMRFFVALLTLALVFSALPLFAAAERQPAQADLNASGGEDPAPASLDAAMAEDPDPADLDAVADVKDKVTWDMFRVPNTSQDDVKYDMHWPATMAAIDGSEVALNWVSNNKSAMYWDMDRFYRGALNSGRVFPAALSRDFEIQLTVEFSRGLATDTKDFTFTVKGTRAKKTWDGNAPRLDRAAFMTEVGEKTKIGLVNAVSADWYSMRTSVATVDEDGVVSAVGEGETKIYARINNTLTLECIVSVGFKGMNPALPPSWRLYIADAEPHVYDGVMYVYGSHDSQPSPPQGSSYCSDNYHVIYSADGIHWTDAGTSFTIADLPDDDGAVDRTPVLWAPDAFKLGDKYYLLSCGRDQDGEYFIAESDSPLGPFNQNVRRIKYDGGPNDGERIGNIDPGVLVVGDKVYLAISGLAGQPRYYNVYFWPSRFRYGQLDVETATVDADTIIDVHDVMDASTVTPKTAPFEGPSLRKFGDWYFYIYVSSPTTSISPGMLEYLKTKDITDPESWVYGGLIVNNADLPGSGNVHGSIDKLGDAYYLTYHTPARTEPGNGSARNFRIDRVEIDLVNGVIQTVPMTSSGARDAFALGEKIQASSYAFGSAGANALVQLREGAAQAAFYPFPLVRFANATHQVGYRYIDFQDGAGKITLRVLTQAEGAGLTLSETKEGSPFATLALPDTAGQWETVAFDVADSPTGVSELYIQSNGGVRVDLDWFRLTNDPVFVPVTGITAPDLTAEVGKDLILTGFVAPENATHQTILWKIQDPSDTGATLTGNIFRAQKKGDVMIVATVTDGKGAGVDYFRYFSIEVKDFSEQEKAALEETIKTGVAQLETWRGKVNDYRDIEAALVEFLVNYYENVLKRADTPQEVSEILAEAKTELGKLRTRVQVESTQPVDLSIAIITQIRNREYTGQEIHPLVTVYAKDKRLTRDTDYTVQIVNNVNIGTASLKVIAKSEAYTGSKTVNFQIVPSRNAISQIALKKGGRAKVTWMKVPAAQKILRYQIRYRMAGESQWKYKSTGATVTNRNLWGLKKGKAYEFQVRSWKSVNRIQYFSPWSAIAASRKMI